jgi:hypothetical protein
VDWAQTVTFISALAVLTGLQAFRIARALDRVHAELDRIDARLDRIESVVLRDHAERIARLEASH